MLLAKVFLSLFCLQCFVQSSIPGKSNDDSGAYIVGLFDDPLHDKSRNISADQDPHLIRLSVSNRGMEPQKIDFQTYLPNEAKIFSFALNHNDILYHAVKVPLGESRKIAKRAVEEKRNAAIYNYKSFESYDVFNEEQTTENVMFVSPQDRVGFNLFYEHKPDSVDLNREKFLSQSKLILDLSSTDFRELDAEITSPNYPYSYPNSVDITWLVRAPSNDVIIFSVNDLDIEECCDRLTIHDGSTSNYPVLGVLTGSLNSSRPFTFTSSSYTMLFRFTTDCSLTKRGFKGFIYRGNIEPTFNYTQTVTPNTSETCSGTEYLYAYTNSYYITSPGYPYYNYQNRMDCAWSIQTNIYSYVVQFEVIEIELEQRYDYLFVYDGSSSSYTMLAQYTGSYNEGTRAVYSTGRYMYIRFTTDSSVTRKGFRVEYQAVSSNTSNNCSGNSYLDLYSGNGTIESPYYPNYYRPDCYYTWFIQGHYSQYVVRLTTNYFYLDYGDYLSIYDGSSIYSPLLKNLTGGLYNYKIQSTGRNMYIVFTSDSVYESYGFRIRYEAVIEQTTQRPIFTEIETAAPLGYCYGTLQYTAYSYESTLTFPGTSYQYYAPNLSCYWILKSYYSGYVVKLSIRSMNIEQYSDYLRLYDGSSSSYRQIASITGTSRGTYYSTQRYMTLRFTTNSYTSSNDVGFQVSYKYDNYQTETTTMETTTNTYCGYSYLYSSTSNVRTFTSPGYPYSYSNNLDCYWRISAYSSYYINQLMVLDIDIEYYDDYLYVYDGSSTSYPLIKTFTGSSNGIVYSSGYYMLVRFQTNSYNVYKGFKAAYASVRSSSCREAIPSNTTDSADIMNNVHTANLADTTTEVNKTNPTNVTDFDLN